MVLSDLGGTDGVLELSSLTSATGVKIYGEMENDNLGRSVSAAGDVNGDGLDDILIGAYMADPNGDNEAGTTYLVYGSSTSGTFTWRVANRYVYVCMSVLSAYIYDSSSFF